MKLKLWYSSSFLFCLFILWNYDVFVACYWFKVVSEIYAASLPTAQLKALGLIFAYRNRTHIIRERKISAFDWSKFQSDCRNGWETNVEEKRAMFLSPNSLSQLWTNVYEITSFEKTDFPACEWNQIHTTNIWDTLLGNVSRTDRGMCEVSASDAIIVAIEGVAPLATDFEFDTLSNPWVKGFTR